MDEGRHTFSDIPAYERVLISFLYDSMRKVTKMFLMHVPLDGSDVSISAQTLNGNRIVVPYTGDVLASWSEDGELQQEVLHIGEELELKREHGEYHFRCLEADKVSEVAGCIDVVVLGNAEYARSLPINP